MRSSRETLLALYDKGIILRGKVIWPIIIN